MDQKYLRSQVSCRKLFYCFSHLYTYLDHAGQKRRSAPTRTDQDTVRTTKTTKRRRSSKSKNLRASDYAGMVKTILVATQKQYRCMIFTQDAFPSPDVELEFATEAWVMQCKRKNVDLDLDDDHFKLVCSATI